MYRILGFDCFNEAAGLLCVLNSSIVFGICHSSLFFYQVRCRRTETIGFIATALAVAQRPSAADSSQAKAARRWLRASARVSCLLRVHSRFRAAHRPVYFSVWTYNGTDRKSSSQLWMFFKLTVWLCEYLELRRRIGWKCFYTQLAWPPTPAKGSSQYFVPRCMKLGCVWHRILPYYFYYLVCI